MIQQGDIARRLYDVAFHEAENLFVEDVRFGMSYAGVRLNGPRMGLAALLFHEFKQGGCSVFPDAGKLAGTRASLLLRYLVEGRNPLEKALGLATANAALHPKPAEDERDALLIMELTPSDRAAMVGLFSPMVPKIEATGAELSIIEKNPERMEVPSREDREKILQECTVAIITATTLLNDTIEEVLNDLGHPRHTAVLGPSTPLCPEAFMRTPVNHLGGSVVRDADKVMQIISEGGGISAMRPYLRFVNLLL